MSGASLVEFLASYGRRQLGGEAWLDAEAAFAELASNRVNGKLVLVIDPSLS